MIRWKKLRIKLEYRFRISFLDRLNDQQFFLPLLISQSLRVCLSEILFFGWIRKERNKTNKTDKSIDDKMEKVADWVRCWNISFSFPFFLLRKEEGIFLILPRIWNEITPRFLFLLNIDDSTRYSNGLRLHFHTFARVFRKLDSNRNTQRFSLHPFHSTVKFSFAFHAIPRS